MFQADRVFCTQNPKTGIPEWYFQAREGNAGPFQSKQTAELKLKQFIKSCIESGVTGGRPAKEGDTIKSPSKLEKQRLVDFKITDQIDWY
jgi:hypothetical protein